MRARQQTAAAPGQAGPHGRLSAALLLLSPGLVLGCGDGGRLQAGEAAIPGSVGADAISPREALREEGSPALARSPGTPDGRSARAARVGGARAALAPPPEDPGGREPLPAADLLVDRLFKSPEQLTDREVGLAVRAVLDWMKEDQRLVPECGTGRIPMARWLLECGERARPVIEAEARGSNVWYYFEDAFRDSE